MTYKKFVIVREDLIDVYFEAMTFTKVILDLVYAYSSVYQFGSFSRKRNHTIYMYIFNQPEKVYTHQFPEMNYFSVVEKLNDI